MHPAEYFGKFGSSLANPCEFGCGESIGESMYMGDPVVQHYGNHLDLVGGDGGPSLFYKGTLYRSGVPPVSWTPNPLGEWRTRCQEQDELIHPSFASR